MATIDITTARKLFDTGHPIRLATRHGVSPVDWASAATGYYGKRTFDEYVSYASEIAAARNYGVMHFECPRPSRRTHDEAAGHVYREEEFEIGNLSGTHFFLADGTMGDLPEKYQDSFRHAEYAVWSYETPIAWLDKNREVVVPPVRYSNTTTQHQRVVARALGKSFTSTESARAGKGKTPYTPREGW